MESKWKRVMGFALSGVLGLAGLVAAAWSPACMAEDVDGLQIEQKYPAGAIHSSEEAEDALHTATEAREAIHRRFEEAQQACYSKFMATSCLNDAKERRRLALLRVRRVEVQANGFKRTERAVERDKAVAAREEHDAARHAGEGGLQVMVDGVPQVPGQPPQAEQVQNDARVAEHEAKVKRLEEKDAADEKKREKNVAAYEKKVKEAKQHQLEIDARKKDDR